MKDWEEESKRFDAAAGYYDLYRPGYPAELIDCMERKAGLGPESRILEIGAGSGKASELLLNRGYGLLCIEPGAQLAEAGRKKHTDKRVEFVVTRFEHWEEPLNVFDLVFSAQAFHWVPKPAGYEKSARTLKPGGQLALFWNMYVNDGDSVHTKLISICKEWQVLPFQNREEIEARIAAEVEGISGSGYFGTPAVYRYPWTQEYNAEAFVGLLTTGNGFLGLSEAEQRSLASDITGIIAGNGGTMTLHYECVLFIAEAK